MENSLMPQNYLESVVKQFKYYKMLGEKTFSQLNDDQIFFQHHEETNSIGIIVNHLWGNMMSRWTNMLDSDGEKPWRKRDLEFTNIIESRNELISKWEEGWNVVFETLDILKEVDLNNIIYIRNIGHTITEALNRQLAHYAYHIGQIVFLGKLFRKEDWNSLSIPKNKSKQYNEVQFSKDKRRGHYTDDIIGDD